MTRPNILLLHTDQQRFDTLAALGATHMYTPNMDRLAARGMAFTSAYSACPVCQPARHDLITGASARHHGYWSNANQPIRDHRLATVPRLLTESGYQTLAVGKMHFSPPREHHGFAHMDLMEELPTCREDDAYLQYLQRMGYGDVRCQHGVRPLFYHTVQESRIPTEHQGSGWVATRTVELLQQDRDRPFFLFASWVGPHPPYYVSPGCLDLYRNADQPVPCAIGDTDPQLQTPVSPENPTGPRLHHIRAGYFAAITQIDLQLGRVLDALDQTGHADDTLILFTADHGEMLGDRGQYQKHVPYEGSAHIPLIACGPGFDAGTCAAPVTTWDVAATILDAAQVAAPEGHPLVGTPLREAGRHTERLVAYHHGGGRRRYVAAVGHDHKFVHWYNGGAEEFYDLAADPWEQHNLAGSGRAEEALLRRACQGFEQEHGQVERVRGEDFVDMPHNAPPPHACSLYPLWSSTQFPRWMNGYSEQDLALIRAEMRDCLRDEHAYICRDPQWREDATAQWEQTGGDRGFYQELFDAVDGRH